MAMKRFGRKVFTEIRATRIDRKRPAEIRVCQFLSPIMRADGILEHEVVTERRDDFILSPTGVNPRPK